MDIRNEIYIDAPARRVWSAVGDRFMHIGEWAAPIASSCPVGRADPAVGTIRSCTTVAFGPFEPGMVEERLTRFDCEQMTLEYEAFDGMPNFIAAAANRWSVAQVDGGRSLVRMHATLTLRGPARLLACVIKWQLQSAGARVAEELRHFVETGQPHPRKLIASRLSGRRSAALSDSGGADLPGR
jgi:hypothetical protein